LALSTLSKAFNFHLSFRWWCRCHADAGSNFWKRDTFVFETQRLNPSPNCFGKLNSTLMSLPNDNHSNFIPYARLCEKSFMN